MRIYQLQFHADHLCLGGKFEKTGIPLWRTRERAEANKESFLRALHARYDNSPFEPDWEAGKIEIVELEIEDEEKAEQKGTP